MYNTKKVFFLTFFLFIINVTFQNNIIDNIIKSDILLKEKIKKIDSTLLSFNKTSDSLANYYYIYSNWLYKNKEYIKAIESVKKIIILEKLKKKNDVIFIQKNTYNLGKYYKKLNLLLKSIKYFNDALKISNNNSIAIKTYYQLGFAYVKINDNIKALENFNTVKFLLNKSKKKNLNLLINTCLNISYLYLNIGGKENLIKGMSTCNFLDSIIKKSSIPLNKKYVFKLNFASYYNQYEFLDIKKSSKYYNESLGYAKTMNDSIRITNTYINLGNLYNTTNFKKSINYLNKATLYCSKMDSINLQFLHNNYALTYARKGLFNESINYYKISFKHLTNLDIDNYHKTDLRLISYKKKILSQAIFTHLGENYIKLFNQKKEPIYLVKSVEYFNKADNIIDLTKINSNEFKSKLFWREKSANIYGKAIKACFLTNNFDDAFYFMEKNKALLLMEDIATENYKLTLDVPKKLLKKETQYKKELFLLESIKVKNKDSILKEKIDLERILLTFQDSIYKGKIYKYKIPKILSISDVQNKLTNNEVLIEYHISKDDGYGIYTNNENAYVLFISKNNIYFYEINEMSKFEKKIKDYLNLLRKPLETKLEFNNFNNLSFVVYNKLFPTNEVKELINNKNLTIITDNILSFLPFESLITNKKNKEYLLKKATISYAYSMSFQKQNEVVSRNPKKEFLSFAPIIFTYDSLPNLNKTEKEIQSIQSFYNGQCYFNEKATKKTFLKQCNNYNILHLATHADANNKTEPWIAFKNKKLHLPELYTTKTQADLVVLSACNTSVGEVVNGEGVLSLARGFFYSGANSVVSSLWNVNDKATSFIMKEFYKNLKNGYTKSDALRNAKINYLDNHQLEYASPFYWSSFILIGNADNLATVPNTNFVYYVFALLLLIIIGILWKFKK